MRKSIMVGLLLLAGLIQASAQVAFTMWHTPSNNFKVTATDPTVHCSQQAAEVDGFSRYAGRVGGAIGVLFAASADDL